MLKQLGVIITFQMEIKKTGTIGHIGCTSFFPSKNLGCYGDGGAMFTNDEVLAGKMRMIANHGQSKKYYHDVVGCNSRLDSIQAAVLKIKLKELDNYIEARRAVASHYDNFFDKFEGVKTPVRANNSRHVFHQYTLTLEGIDRDGLNAFLAEKKHSFNDLLSCAMLIDKKCLVLLILKNRTYQ